nr:unnamed protein product [Callosobruchus chinensis]
MSGHKKIYTIQFSLKPPVLNLMQKQFICNGSSLELLIKEKKQNHMVKITSLIENIHSKQQLLQNKTVDIVDVEI